MRAFAGLLLVTLTIFPSVIDGVDEDPKNKSYVFYPIICPYALEFQEALRQDFRMPHPPTGESTYLVRDKTIDKFAHLSYTEKDRFLKCINEGKPFKYYADSDQHNLLLESNFSIPFAYLEKNCPPASCREEVDVELLIKFMKDGTIQSKAWFDFDPIPIEDIGKRRFPNPM